jgi:iron(III) transport system permease protein
LSATQSSGLIDPPPLSLARLGSSVARTLTLAGCVSSLSLLLGTWLAWAGEKTRYPGSRVLGLLGTLPLAIPSYLLAAILREEFAPKGTIGAVLGTDNAFAGFGPAVLVLTLTCTPYVQLLVTSALHTLPQAEDEAARSLGASRWKRFRQLAAPRLRPTWAFALTLIGLYVVSDFGAVAVLDYHVLTWDLYHSRGAHDSYLIALGILLCVIPLLVGIQRVRGAAQQDSRQGGPRSPIQPPRMKGPPLLFAYLGHLFMVGVGVILPLCTLLGWVFGGWIHRVSFAGIVGPLTTTLWYATLGAGLILATSLIPAAFSSRSLKSAKWTEAAAFITSSLPGILVAFGILHLVLFVERKMPLLFWSETIWDTFKYSGGLLFLGYVMRFLSQGYAAVRPALLQVDLRQVEAAHSLGANSLKRFRYIWLPAVTPGLAAAYFLGFISVAKELPVTLMLAMPGHQTLAYRIFDAQSEASLPDAGLAGLLLLGIAAGAQLAVLRLRRYAE